MTRHVHDFKFVQNYRLGKRKGEISYWQLYRCECGEEERRRVGH